MCDRALKRTRVTIGGVPVRVEACPQHAHARAVIGAAGARINLETQKRTEALALACMDGMIEHALALGRAIAAVPCMASLFIGQSIIAPGQKLTRPAQKFLQVASRLLTTRAGIASPSFDVDAMIAAIGNDLLFAMFDARLPMKKRKIAEANYTALVRIGLDFRVNVPAIQHAYNRPEEVTA